MVGRPDDEFRHVGRFQENSGAFGGELRDFDADKRFSV
jgi:hypothetical protein